MKREKRFLVVLGSLSLLVAGLAVHSTTQATSRRDEGTVNDINYYYMADVQTEFHNNDVNHSNDPVTLTVNHYVDGYTGIFYLYKQEQYFHLSSNALLFKPEEHYLNFDWTEWDPEFSHTNLETDAPIRIDEDLDGGTINYYYMADIRTEFHNNRTNYKQEPTTMTLNHYVDGYTGVFHLHKQEQYFHLSSNALNFDPKEHYIDFSWTEWDPEFSHTNLVSDDIIHLD